MLSVAILAGFFVIGRLLFARAQAACQQVSDQCADAGFAWEVLAAVSLLLIFLCIFAALFGWVWSLLGRVGRWLQVLFALGFVALLCTAYLNFLTLGLRAKAGEAKANLSKLKKAQIHHHRKHGVYRAAQRAPQSDSEGRLFWPKPLPKDSGWADLGWHLVGVRSWCQYEVELKEDGFIARSFCDLDHDGKVGVFEVTHDHSPRRVTPHY